MSERREITRRLDTLGDVAEIMGALKNAAMVEAIRLRRYVPAQQRVMRTVECRNPGFPDALSATAVRERASG